VAIEQVNFDIQMPNDPDLALKIASPLDDSLASVAEMHARYTPEKENWADQLWRLHNIYFIVDEFGNKVRFKPNWGQVEFIKNMWYLNVILKARQLGFTTFIDLLLLDNTVFLPNKKAGIVCHNREDAAVIFRDKVKYPYDSLPEEIREQNPANRDSTNELVFQNKSSIRVGTSMRSGTLNYLHISEYGKMCAKFPDKAREVRTGALNTVHAGQFIAIESTAEGKTGHFFDLCNSAMKAKAEERPLTPLDFEFHFFPWWKNPKYTLHIEDETEIVIDQGFREYFLDLEKDHGIFLTVPQKVWYVKKSDQQAEDMKREFPSTPEEAFEQSLEGAFYKKRMAKVRAEKRIRPVPYLPGFPVNTFWDLGGSDETALWCHQHIGTEHRFIRYFEASGEAPSYFVGQMQKWDYDIWGKHYLPHDADQQLMATVSKYDLMYDAGLRNLVVLERIQLDQIGIDAVREILPACWFDAEKTSVGIACLDGYRKEWDDKLGCWRDKALHDKFSHGAKAFEQFALGYRQPQHEKHGEAARRKREGRRRRNAMVV
jgi:hypothetical protein